ncbi:MAG: hypothetical protein GY839_05825 [candidate division Zixibacteria bacterium]|nr:hypothetical protein [candidate division Zixibacteria bacterium]
MRLVFIIFTILLIICNVSSVNTAYADSFESKIADLVKVKLSFNTGWSAFKIKDMGIPSDVWRQASLDDPINVDTMFEPENRLRNSFWSMESAGRPLKNIELGLGILNQLYLNLGVAFDKNEDSGSLNFLSYTREIKFVTKTTLPYIGLEYNLNVIEMIWSNAISFARGKSEIDLVYSSDAEGSSQGRYESLSKGFMVSSGLSYKFYKYLCINVRGGYRFFKSDDPEPKYGQGGIPFKLDLRGPYAAFGLGIDLR